MNRHNGEDFAEYSVNGIRYYADGLLEIAQNQATRKNTMSKMSVSIKGRPLTFCK